MYPDFCLAVYGVRQFIKRAPNDSEKKTVLCMILLLVCTALWSTSGTTIQMPESGSEKTPIRILILPVFEVGDIGGFSRGGGRRVRGRDEG